MRLIASELIASELIANDRAPLLFLIQWFIYSTFLYAQDTYLTLINVPRLFLFLNQVPNPNLQITGLKVFFLPFPNF